MQLEFHQLDRRWEHLRVRQPQQQRRRLASLAECGQQTPIVVVEAADQPGRYVVIDGHKRIAALQHLGRDTVEAIVWPTTEAEALLLDRTSRMSQQETELEQGWLLREMQQLYKYSLEERALRFDRSTSWISRRLALVELLPEAIQQQVREGKIAAQLAMKYLAPVARISVDDCERMAAAFAAERWNTREAATVSENAATTASARHYRGRRAGTRSGYGRRHLAARRPAAHRGAGGNGRPALGAGATKDRAGAPGSGPYGPNE